MSDPILASNPANIAKFRDPERPGKWWLTDHSMEEVEERLRRAKENRQMLRARGDEWKRRAEAAEAELESLRQEANRYRVAAGNEAQTRAALETTIVTLRESAEFDAEMRRSLSASVEELKEALAVARRIGAKYAETCDEAIAAGRAAVLREREEIATWAEELVRSSSSAEVAAKLQALVDAIRSRGGQ